MCLIGDPLGAGCAPALSKEQLDHQTDAQATGAPRTGCARGPLGTDSTAATASATATHSARR